MEVLHMEKSTIMYAFEELCNRLGCSDGKLEGNHLNFYEDVSRHGSPLYELTRSIELDPVQLKVFTALREIQSDVKLLSKRNELARVRKQLESTKAEARSIEKSVSRLEEEMRYIEAKMAKAEG